MSGTAARRSRERTWAMVTLAAMLGVPRRTILRENRRPVRYSRALESLRREARREYAFGKVYTAMLQRFAEQIVGAGVEIEMVPHRPWIDPLVCRAKDLS